MTQEFKKALPLIDGHGNFGNIEGDGAAAMRYTEARLQRVTPAQFRFVDNNAPGRKIRAFDIFHQSAGVNGSYSQL